MGFFNNLYAYFGYLDGQDVITHDLRANFLSLEMKEAIVGRFTLNFQWIYCAMYIIYICKYS